MDETGITDRLGVGIGQPGGRLCLLLAGRPQHGHTEAGGYKDQVFWSNLQSGKQTENVGDLHQSDLGNKPKKSCTGRGANDLQRSDGCRKGQAGECDGLCAGAQRQQ